MARQQCLCMVSNNIKEETLMPKKPKGFGLVANNEEQKVQD